MRKTITNRLAFSLLELIFVIIILGVIASVGSEIIAKVYEGYIIQRAEHRASVKTQLTLNQIANRLRYAIPGTIVRRVGKTGTAELATSTMASNPNDYTVLQWVAADNDSFQAISSDTNRQPGWSGFCDVAASSDTVLSTPGSNFTLANAIQSNLGGSGTFSVYFPGDPTAHFGTGAGSTITLTTAAARIVERYKLSWTSYALVVESGDLYLYYNFSPTIGATIGATKSLLLKSVSNFKFETRGQTTRIKLCGEESIGSGNTLSSCKEKAVF